MFDKPKLVRRRIRYKKKNQHCKYCGQYLPLEERTIDHIIPKSKGGVDCPNNYYTSCKPCNLLRGSDIPAGVFIKMRRTMTTDEILTVKKLKGFN